MPAVHCQWSVVNLSQPVTKKVIIKAAASYGTGGGALVGIFLVNILQKCLKNFEAAKA